MIDLTTLSGASRAIVDRVFPCIDDGVYPAKRAIGDDVTVRAHAFCDGHDKIRAELMHRRHGTDDWTVTEMRHDVNDVWCASFVAPDLGAYEYTVRAWVDRLATWRRDLEKKFSAGQDVKLELEIGARILEDLGERTEDPSCAETIAATVAKLRELTDVSAAVAFVSSTEFAAVAETCPDRSLAATYRRVLTVQIDPRRAAYSTWYELFPRSTGKAGRHGTFRTCEKLLPDIAAMGFDILYLPPVHPIGRVNRKGKNNAPTAARGDVGSPWAIGSTEGGHKAIHPRLGTIKDFEHFVATARDHGLDVAMDIAFQCAPDHPYVREHPEWFRMRPDGSVQYAENPPKKYEDIFPFDFECTEWQSLWEELKSVVEYWISHGVRTFRVDNPHTKPFAFWEWLIAEVRKTDPDVVFLAEAFTRPKVMARLAKAGFNQSYTYFTWRNTKHEIEGYVRELTETELGEYFRPNFWPNTPDILPEFLQHGDRPAFVIRLALAATLSSNYGIYGPAFENCIAAAVDGREEYLDSEKYEIKTWEPNAPGNIRAVVERINRIRRDNPSLHVTRGVRFLEIDNEAMICFAKKSPDGSNATVTVVSLDPHHVQSGWIEVPLDFFGIDEENSFLMEDGLTGDRYIWRGTRNFVELDPRVMPAHIMTVRSRLRRETDFDYFL